MSVIFYEYPPSFILSVLHEIYFFCSVITCLEDVSDNEIIVNRGEKSQVPFKDAASRASFSSIDVMMEI